MERLIKAENYTVVHGWMITELGLSGNDLLVYSVIYGFTQAENQWYTGTHNYLAEWINGSRRTVLRSLQALEENGLIEKENYSINGVTFCKYRAKFVIGCDKLSQGCDKTSPNNIDNNDISNDISNSYTERVERVGKNPTKVQREDTRFKKPTVEEIAEYCRDRNNGIDAQRFFDYYEAKGWLIGKTKMKDWRAAVRTWERGSGTGAGTATRGGKIDYEAEMTEKEREWLKGLDRDED